MFWNETLYYYYRRDSHLTMYSLFVSFQSMRIDKVANFPFPTSPDNDQIKVRDTIKLNSTFWIHSERG